MESRTRRWSWHGLESGVFVVTVTTAIANLGRDQAPLPNESHSWLPHVWLLCVPLMLALAVLEPIGERLARLRSARGDSWFALGALLFAFWPLVPGLGFPLPDGAPTGSLRAKALLPYVAVGWASIGFLARIQVAEHLRRTHAWQQRAARTRTPSRAVFDSLQQIVASASHDPATTQRTAVLLEQWLRAAAVERDPAQRTLQDELAMLQPYLELQRLRFGGRVDITVDVPTELLAARAPDALLLPLVEHTIERAITPRGAGSLRVAARADRRWLVLEIADDGPPPAQEGEPNDVESVPAATIRQARALCVLEGWLELRRNERAGTTTWVRLPLEYGKVAG